MASTQILRVSTVENEIRKDPDMKMEYLQMLKDWISKQPHLPSFDNDLLLLQFLRRCRYSIEKAKVKLDNYLSFRTHCPELTTHRGIDQPDILEVLENWHFVVLPNRDQHGNVVIVAKLLTEDATIFKPGVLLKFFLSLMENYLRENGTIPGYVVVVDAQKAGLAHLGKCNLTICKQAYFFVQKCCPASIKGVYSVNSSSIAETAIKFFKSIIQGNMISQIQVFPQGSIEGLYEHVPKDILPEEYGGNAGRLEDLHRETYELIKRGGSYFTTLDKLKVHEEKRTGGTLNLEGVFGLEGTFKKLNVD